MLKQRIKSFFKRTGIFVVTTVVMAVMFLYTIMWILVNGPSTVLRDLFVMSVRETSAAGFLADIFLTEEEIAEIEKNNELKSTDEVTDTSLIVIDKHREDKGPILDDEDSDEEKEEIKFVNGIAVQEVTGSTFKGYMMLIEDPSRVFVGVSSKKFSKTSEGRLVTNIIDSYGAVAGTNAGGFEDTNGSGKGGMPTGIVISEGELLAGSRSGTYEVIGINKENVLIVGRMTGQQALDRGVRDAVSFGPTLIVNGEAMFAQGTGSGLNPRTAIGQTADGTMLLLVIEGRQATSLGASYNDLIRVMLDYGAVNAANLDGGSSSVMYNEGNLINANASLVGLREVPTAIVVK